MWGVISTVDWQIHALIGLLCNELIASMIQVWNAKSPKSHYEIKYDAKT